MHTRLRLARRAHWWIAAGMCGGLSYLARPEGVAAIMILAAAVILYTAGLHPMWPGQRPRQWRRNRAAFPWSHAAGSCALLAAGFLLIAAPYMGVIGKFTGKKDISSPEVQKVEVQKGDTPASRLAPSYARPLGVVDPSPITFAAATPVFDLVTWQKLAMELLETFGWAPWLVLAGALLLKPRLWGRPHWRALFNVWFTMWLAVMIWLIHHSGYLDGRHTLAMQLALHCLFALALPIWERPMRWWQNCVAHRPGPRGLLARACLPGCAGTAGRW